MNLNIIYRFLTFSFLFVFLSACSEKIILYKEMTEADANEIVGVLLSSDVYAEKKLEKEGVSVFIEREDMADAVSILKSAGLPNKAQQTLGEVFKKEGVISTPLEERARYIYALSQELEFTLSQIDNVMTARVHVVLPERVAPGQPIQPSSAAVFIKHHADLDPDVIRSRVHSLVSSSIPGLSTVSEDKISVTFIESSYKPQVSRWEKVGPFMVQKNSAGSLVNLFFVIGLIFLGLIAALVLVILRMRGIWPKKKNQQQPEQQQPNLSIAS